MCCCSRQVGKSFTAAAKIVHHAISNPNSMTACISTGERAAAEFLLKCKQWAEACFACAPADLKPSLSYSFTAAGMKFANGSRIIILPSGNPGALRGYSGNLLIDEFAIMENDSEVWAAIAPLITSEMSGSGKKFALILSTPTSMDTRFAKIWFSQDGEWEKHKITIEDAVREGLKVNIPELKKIIADDFIWNTEYMVEFASTADTAFPSEWLRDLHTGFSEYDPTKPAYLGGDIARTSDLTVFSALQKDGSGNYHLVGLKLLKSVSFNEQLEVLKALNKKFHFASGYIDATGIGNMFAEEAARVVSARLKPFVFTGSSKNEIFERLRKVCADNQLKTSILDEESVRSDLSLMKRMIGKAGQISFQAPHSKSGHADIACSLALGVAACHDMTASFALPESFSYNSAFGSRTHFF